MLNVLKEGFPYRDHCALKLHTRHKRRILRNKTDENSKRELEKVDQELSEKYSDVMSRKILNEVKGMEDTTNGGFNTGKLWKLKKKSRIRETPTLSNDADSRTDTNLKRLHDLSKITFFLLFAVKKNLGGVQNIFFLGGGGKI